MLKCPVTGEPSMPFTLYVMEQEGEFDEEEKEGEEDDEE